MIGDGGIMDFDALLEESVKAHGHLCPGQVLGVRMAIAGLAFIGINDPRGAQRKDFLVYVEIDRCATDAIGSVTGATLGKRSLKFVDYGKMAASFLNLTTGRAVRIVAKETARDMARNLFPGIEDKYDAQTAAYRQMPDKELFDWMDVIIMVAPKDMPGRPLKRVRCDRCGEYVQDLRDISIDSETLCIPCAKGGYYRPCQDCSGMAG